MEALNYLAKIGQDYGFEFITKRLKFDSSKPHNFTLKKMNYDTNPYPKGVLNEKDMDLLIAIGKDYFRHLARDSHNPNFAHLSEVLDRILSQDFATKEIAFDIQEYLDYFTKFIKDDNEKIRFAEDIIAAWK